MQENAKEKKRHFADVSTSEFNMIKHLLGQIQGEVRLSENPGTWITLEVAGIALEDQVKNRNVTDFWIDQSSPSNPSLVYANCAWTMSLPFLTLPLLDTDVDHPCLTA